MFIQEAQWIQSILEGVELEQGMQVLDIGSSSLEFRTIIQPHIHRYIHEPLIEKGVQITTLDTKQAEGVDLVMDLTQPNLVEKTFDKKFDLVICCNILEHVEDRRVFLENVLKYCRPHGQLLLTVPRQYPKHNDPIDTMYRPTPRELEKFVASMSTAEVLQSEVLSISDRQYYPTEILRKKDYLTLKPIRMWVSWFFPPLRWKVTCMLLKIQ